MEFNLETIVFYFLAAFITVFSILTVTTRRMVRSATYLLFVLFGTAGIYFLLGIYIPRLCTDYGVRRRYSRPLRLLHPAHQR